MYLFVAYIIQKNNLKKKLFVSFITRVNCQSNPASLYSLNKPNGICKLTDQNSKATTQQMEQ